jgi:hypothetical protein
METCVRAEFCKQHLTWLTCGWELYIVVDIIEQPRCVVVAVAATTAVAAAAVICLLKC